MAEETSALKEITEVLHDDFLPSHVMLETATVDHQINGFQYTKAQHRAGTKINEEVQKLIVTSMKLLSKHSK